MHTTMYTETSTMKSTYFWPPRIFQQKRASGTDMKISNMPASVRTIDCVFTHTYRKTKTNEMTESAMSMYAASVTHQRHRNTM